jgi:hypothetical protein
MCKKIRTLQKWEFYYSEGINETVTATRSCLFPCSTKQWNNLKKQYERKEVTGIGCRVVEPINV